MTTTLEAQRAAVRQVLDEADPADAPTAYYALYHDPARSKLFIHSDQAGRTLGFAGVFQTGIDLFRPLLTLLCPDAACVRSLLSEALTPGRSYILFARVNQLPLLRDMVRLDQVRILHILRLDPRRFQPVINVLARHEMAYDGTPRCVIEAGGAQAVAGLNWQSPAFAEVFVRTDPPLRGRGLGTSVVAGVTQAVLAGGRTPLYLVEEDNEPSRRIAETLGYVDTGARQVYADVVYTGSVE
jgi:RimJ/RimL family protein N-acetyltransferase